MDRHAVSARPHRRSSRRSLRDRRPARCRRHGRGVSRARHEAEARRRDQGAARVGSRATPIGSRGSSAKRRLLASLNHPNIAAIYGLEKSSGAHGARDGARRRADARGAHRASARFRSTRRCRSRGRSPRRSKRRTSKGIIHRDLKPANIKVRARRHREGARLRARRRLSDARRRHGRPRRTHRRSRPAAMTGARDDPRHGGLHEPRTGAGPRGRQADATSGRSAVVLYEMLTGQRAVRGRRPCRTRWRPILDARTGLDGAAGGHASADSAPASPLPRERSHTKARRHGRCPTGHR